MINRVTLIGNLGADPEVRHLENGVMVGRFSLATNENYKDKDGNWQSQTEWHNVVVWRDMADRAEKMLKKGMQVFVEGKITYRKYTGQDNVERYATDIVANTMRILGPKEGSSGTGYAENRFPSADSAPAARNGNDIPTKEPVAVAADGDDLPF